MPAGDNRDFHIGRGSAATCPHPILMINLPEGNHFAERSYCRTFDVTDGLGFGAQSLGCL
jgi:hypothetical protein